MSELENFLLQLTEHEEQQKKTGHFIPDFSILNQQQPQLPNELFFQNKNIYISKHSRFAPYPKHSHQFLEINYIYKGKCQQKINGKKYGFQQGDILIMDAGTSHSISKLDEEDLVINILFKNSDISIEWLTQMQGSQSILYQFLLNSSSKTQQNNFLVIRSEHSKNAQAVLYQMMCEYFLPQDFSQAIVTHYLSIFLLELARSLPTIEGLNEQPNDPFIQVLSLIDKHYDTLTLSEASDLLSFNKNYLSNLIKKKSQKTFTELINQKKITKAHLLIESTQLSIDDIMVTVGYSNKTYFYKHYQAFYKETPAQTRKQSNYDTYR